MWTACDRPTTEKYYIASFLRPIGMSANHLTVIERLYWAHIRAGGILEFLDVRRTHTDWLGEHEPAHALAAWRRSERAFVMMITPVRR